MEKYIVEIEFRYTKINKNNCDYDCDYNSINDTVTIGIYDTFENACIYGNKVIEDLENCFKLHKFPDGRVAKKQRFSKNGGCFGFKNDLITNLAYLQTPFSFFASIKTLKFEVIQEKIKTIVEDIEEYKKFKNSNIED